jgi:superfamily I DNA and/or RNA helicase
LFSSRGPNNNTQSKSQPGTGKTTTIVELIHQAIHQYSMIPFKKILVTAPSNVAVDNILARLVASTTTTTATTTTNPHRKKNRTTTTTTSSHPPTPPGPPPSHHARRLRMVRLGHPARIQPDILSYSLDALVQSADGTEIVQQIRRELQQHLDTLSLSPPPPKHTKASQSSKSYRENKRHAYHEMKVLRKEIRQREEKVVHELLQQAQVVLATCVGAASPLLASLQFDMVIIDEAAQALEASCWIPALQAHSKLILAGGKNGICQHNEICVYRCVGVDIVLTNLYLLYLWTLYWVLFLF